MTSTPVSPHPLPRSAPGAMGVNPDGIAAFVQAANRDPKIGGLHGMMLLRRGHVVAETWWAPYAPNRRHLLWSLSKSFTSTAVGLAIHEGHFGLDDPVLSFFPDVAPTRVSDHLASMRVRHLLTMSAGHEVAPEVRHDPDWVRAFLSFSVPREPGTHFVYNTFGTMVLSAIVQRRTGQRLTDYLTPRLFAPLGIVDPHWEQSPLGIDIGTYGLSIFLEDLAKFGQLYLQRGTWNGHQLLPVSWVDEATSAQVASGSSTNGADWSQGYGYQFWRCRHNGIYRGDGAFGQFCIVMPQQQAVLAILSHVKDMQAVLDLAWQHLLPAMGDRMHDRGAALDLPPQSVPVVSGATNSPLMADLSGRAYRMEENHDGIRSFAFTFDDRGGGATLRMGQRDDAIMLPIGLGDWAHGQLCVHGVPRAVASRGVWEDERTLTVKTCFTERPDDWTQTYRFEDDRIVVTNRKMRFGFSPVDSPELRGAWLR